MNRSSTAPAVAHNVRVASFGKQMNRTERAAAIEALERQEMAELARLDIARRIKQARKEAGLSQPEMADAVGVIERTYQNYESEKNPRTPWSLMNQIATVTGRSTEWLLHGSEPTPDLTRALSSEDPAIAERLDRIERSVAALRDLITQDVMPKIVQLSEQPMPPPAAQDEQPPPGSTGEVENPEAA